MTILSPLSPELDQQEAFQTERPLRLLHVVRSLEVGGLERVVCDLALERGLDHTRIACLTARGDFADAIEQRGGVVYNLSADVRGRFDLWSQLVGVMRAYEPDVVHCHNMFAHAMGALAAMRVGGIPTVLTKHGTYLPRSWSRHLLHRRLMQRSSVVAVSREIQDILLGWSPKLRTRLTYIPNGIAVPSVTMPDQQRRIVRGGEGWDDHEWVFISVCRMVTGKRIDILLRAFSQVLASAPGSRLILVGDGPELEALKDLALDLRLGGAVSFLGQRMDVGSLLGAADTFVLSSQNEGMPMALLEAMGAELPVIATSVGEISSLVLDQVTGSLVPPCDIDGLAEAMRKAATERESACRMGERGRKHVIEKFSLRSTLASYEAIYHGAARPR
jgi:L-malate glycosyltransferase